MKCLPAIIVAIVLVTAEAKVVPTSENQQTDTQPVQFSDYIREAQNNLAAMTSQLQEHLNLPNRDEFFNTMKEHSTNLANNLQSYITNTTEEVKAKAPELENLWTNVKNKLSEAVEKLNVNPETAEQVAQLRTKFQEGVQSIVSESQNAFAIANENAGKVQDDFKKIAKQIAEIAVHESQNLSNQLQQAATPQPQN
ncbi:uncharacterized protein [Linepithema humile]|uniref:uncharacterized protein n=1 Tax=Linepithema humile TaxID=83485 RepID=UPI0006233F66|nr:PREDICTED: uncharacterized protein LOC105668188 [Linepithema humile]